jgi:hypothetical protein
LKFLHRLQQAREGTSNRKAARESYICQCPFASEVRAEGAAARYHELRKRGTEAGKHRGARYFKGNVALAGRLASVLSNRTKTAREMSR